ncbi:unnamed protein product, partial [Meganyctiphanes norvegica]
MTGESEVFFSFGYLMYSYILSTSDSVVGSTVSYNYRITTETSGGASTWFRRRRDADNKGNVRQEKSNETEQIQYEATQVECIYTFTINITNVKFYNISKRINPCNEENQSNSGAPYIEVTDSYNVTTRICNLDGETIIDSFSDTIDIKILGEFDNSMVPVVNFSVTQSKHCCGGVFYAKYGKGTMTSKQMATSPHYPSKYEPNQKCAYIFKCIPKEANGTCRIGIHFVDFELEGSNRQLYDKILTSKGEDPQTKDIEPGSNDTNSLISLSEKSPGPNNKCGRKDQILISTCGVLYPKNSIGICAGDHPDSYEGNDQVLLMFLSNGDIEDRGWVVYYHVLDDEFGTYTEQENNEESC